ncbi:MAG TPA: TraB/GumN family protein [Allosphingosinicella sp.]|nr:TraB/GumN family protein [Allosphingosinicella sp.]
MKHLFLAAALAFAPAPAFALSQAPAAPAAQTAPLPDADPGLWVVRDADTTIYLFGTFHLLDGRTWFNDEVKTAFDASQELVVEVLLPEDPAEQQALMLPIVLRYAIDPQGRTISSRLTEAQNAALNRTLGGIGVPAGALDRFEPWFVSLTLTQAAAQQLHLNPQNGPETVLRRAATARHLPQAELETVESQIQVLDGVPEEDQLRGLREALDDVEEMPVKLAPMLEAWSRGDVERLATLMNEDVADDRALYDALFTNRNANWARWIRERMARPGTVFVAVGAGHLAGRSSVQDQLQTLGIQSARIPHVAAR